jgi:hypothetical protein
MATDYDDDQEPLAYVEGWNAHAKGEPWNWNPYHPQTQAANWGLWSRGWTNRKDAMR